MEMQFLGANETVTGSKYLLKVKGKKILVDCGLYQGIKKNRLRNWEPFPIDPKLIDAILLTHAHIDHSGYIPALCKKGFKGPIYCTEATQDLCKVLLPDAGYLQEEDARYANKHHFSKHKPALPLYTEKDAQASLKQFRPTSFNKPFKPIEGLTVTFVPNNHILGSSCVVLDDGQRKTIFSGDVGRANDLIMKPPTPIDDADFLILESTYGDRLHTQEDIVPQLTRIINTTFERGGIVLIPAFAVGRTQTLLYLIHQLKQQNAIPNVPVYLNSPMAISATEIFYRHHKEHKLSNLDCKNIDNGTHFIRTPEESITLNNQNKPAIIISASGMASGGRVLHHLKKLAPNPQNSLVFVGFQAPGTRGDAIIHGASEIKIHGQYVPIHAEVHRLDNLSAHADYQEIISWLKNTKHPPKKVFITHGEPAASDAMRLHVQDQLGWPAHVPEYKETADLS